jgi:hypothetical protein
VKVLRRPDSHMRGRGWELGLTAEVWRSELSWETEPGTRTKDLPRNGTRERINRNGGQREFPEEKRTGYADKPEPKTTGRKTYVLGMTVVVDEPPMRSA